MDRETLYLMPLPLPYADFMLARIGMYILHQWSSSRSKNTPTAHFVRKRLVPIFIRLSIQARTFSQEVIPVPWLSDGLFAPSAAKDIHDEEEHLDAARNALDVLLFDDIYAGPYSLKLFSSDFTISQTASVSFYTRLSEWLVEYHKHLLPVSSPPLSSPRSKNINLTLWYTVLTLLQASLYTADPMAVDKYIPQFKQIVDLARLLSCSSTSSSLSQHGLRASDMLDAPQFRIDLETVPMLYHVGSKCRHPALRREAIALLRKGGSREGLWDGWAAATLAEDIMTVEEEGVERVELRGPESIPRTQRVVKLQEVTDLQARTTRVQYQKFGEGDYGKWRILTW
jgi:hypothetical protein